MLRYLGTDVTTAGLLVGAATVVGGIGGTTLGAKVAEHYLRRVKSAFFLVPALFTLPAAALLIVALNVTSSVALTGVLLILSQIMFWTATAPISGKRSPFHPITYTYLTLKLIFTSHIHQLIDYLFSLVVNGD